MGPEVLSLVFRWPIIFFLVKLTLVVRQLPLESRREGEEGGRERREGEEGGRERREGEEGGEGEGGRDGEREWEG